MGSVASRVGSKPLTQPPSTVPADGALPADWAQRIRAAAAAHGLEAAVAAEPAALSAAAAAEPAALAAAAHQWMAADTVGQSCIRESTGAKQMLGMEDVVEARKARGAWPGEAGGIGDGDVAERGWLFGGGREQQVLRIPDRAVPGVAERGGEDVKVYRDELFTNWGRTQKAVPRYTFVPRTRAGVVNVVRFAAMEGLSVRAAGARHSWSDVFGRDGGVLISFMELDAAVPKTDIGIAVGNPQDNELKKIRVEEEVVGGDGLRRARVRVGAAATSDHLRA
jgi:hypothetical protein